MAEPLAEILEPSYLGGLGERSLDDIRAMRDLCQQVEGGLSYVRRLAHGRLDIVGGELARRRKGGDPSDLADLVAQLPELLTDSGSSGTSGRASRAGRPLELGEPSAELEAELDAIVGADDLSGLTDLSDAELQGVAEGLVEFERTVSDRRRRVHERIDTLQAEIARRYRDGEASIQSMLD